MRSPVAIYVALGLAAAPLAIAAGHAQTHAAKAWRGCCGLAPWATPGAMDRRPQGTGGLFQGFEYIIGGSPLRHELGVNGELPAEYAKRSNPLPRTVENARRGAALYEAQCASCHGAAGLGDGPASRALNPPPAHLGWLAKVPARKRDGFIYWSIAEGGEHLHTDMPAYRGKLTEDEIWALTGYIQARLPPPKSRAKPPASEEPDGGPPQRR